MSQDIEKHGHAIDGIEEYDNPLPRWWLWLFYITITFSIIYWVLYPGFWQGILGYSSVKEYEGELQTAKTMLASSKPAASQGKGTDLTALLGNKSAVEEGKAIFNQNCAACHGTDAKGKIGPNLTDKEWIYGGTADAIVNTITNGTAKGMPPWKALGSEKINKAAAYVHSLGGS